MEIRNIRTFLRVAELQSFTKAAEQMGYSQAAVTVQIKQLEEELGTQLFDRIGKHIKLTEHGMQFMDHGMKVMKAAEDASTFVIKRRPPPGNYASVPLHHCRWACCLRSCWNSEPCVHR